MPSFLAQKYFLLANKFLKQILRMYIWDKCIFFSSKKINRYFSTLNLVDWFNIKYVNSNLYKCMILFLLFILSRSLKLDLIGNLEVGCDCHRNFTLGVIEMKMGCLGSDILMMSSSYNITMLSLPPYFSPIILYL